jgi:predicted transcriptional regulator
MLERGLIDKVKLGNPSVTYRVTKKGLRILRSIDAVLECLELRGESEL